MSRYVVFAGTVVMGLSVLVVSSPVARTAQAASEPAGIACPLVPVPKVYRETGGRWSRLTIPEEE